MEVSPHASVGDGFSKPGVHSLTAKDDFCSFAADLRSELLRFPSWKEMIQDVNGIGQFVPRRQNGITTGHLGEEDRARLPYCLQFRDLLTQNLEVLCRLVGVDPASALSIEINAMAYGSGAWLSPHTDSHGDKDHGRLAAWMLYLTAPEDGEWSADRGGAVRVWIPGGEEERLYPKFNRFAMFRVRHDSFHEIERVTWEPEWSHCRMALSGWVRGRTEEGTVPRGIRVYTQSSSARKSQEETELRLRGSLAVYRLLAKQKEYCGRGTGSLVDRISELERDYQAHLEAPPGTSFLRRAAGPQGCIIVLNEAGDTAYFGAPEGFLANGDAATPTRKSETASLDDIG
jgi:hypothetical protein